MNQVTLYHLKRSDIEISIKISFTDQGQLYFDGYDIGKTVEELWGDSDYEYTYTIEPDQVCRLYKIFGLEEGDKTGLLLAIQERFSGNQAYSLFGDFMSAHNISFTGFTWA